MSSAPTYETFVITAPGLERLAAAELERLGVRDFKVIVGGVTFSASPQLLYTANLHLRTASRVVIRIGAFGAKAFRDLEHRAGKVPWDAFLSPNLQVSLRVTCRKSRLYHSDAVAERVASAMASRVRGVSFAAGSDDESADDESSVEQLVMVRMFHDQCTISVDSSGRLLHLRGYRQAVARAPIRETLAAAALMASGWQPDAPLLDPMCGSGTIPIEGALMARRIPPGLGREFAFAHWPDFDRATWDRVLDEARSAVLPTVAAPIEGSDRDAGAVESARANAERAGVASDIAITERTVSAIEPPTGKGWLISNPPYGVRVGDRDRLRNLYAQFGKVVRAKCAGWRVGLISGAPELERQTGLGLQPILRTTNGGIPVRLVTGIVGADSTRTSRAKQGSRSRTRS